MLHAITSQCVCWSISSRSRLVDLLAKVFRPLNVHVHILFRILGHIFVTIWDFFSTMGKTFMTFLDIPSFKLFSNIKCVVFSCLLACQFWQICYAF